MNLILCLEKRSIKLNKESLVKIAVPFSHNDKIDKMFDVNFEFEKYVNVASKQIPNNDWCFSTADNIVTLKETCLLMENINILVVL